MGSEPNHQSSDVALIGPKTFKKTDKQVLAQYMNTIQDFDIAKVLDTLPIEHKYIHSVTRRSLNQINVQLNPAADGAKVRSMGKNFDKTISTKYGVWQCRNEFQEGDQTLVLDMAWQEKDFKATLTSPSQMVGPVITGNVGKSLDLTLEAKATKGVIRYALNVVSEGEKTPVDIGTIFTYLDMQAQVPETKSIAARIYEAIVAGISNVYRFFISEKSDGNQGHREVQVSEAKPKAARSATANPRGSRQENPQGSGQEKVQGEDYLNPDRGNVLTPEAYEQKLKRWNS